MTRPKDRGVKSGPSPRGQKCAVVDSKDELAEGADSRRFQARMERGRRASEETRMDQFNNERGRAMGQALRGKKNADAQLISACAAAVRHTRWYQASDLL